MERILLELSEQNAHANGDDPPAKEGTSGSAPDAAPSASPAAGAPVTERTPSERDSQDGSLRAPSGAASARAYLPAQPLTSAAPVHIETKTVEVDDPRRWPTVRLPREPKPSAEARSPGRAPRSVLVQEDTAPTLRSAPVSSLRERPSSNLRWWIGGVVLAALVSGVVVALAAHLWPAVPPAQQKEPTTASTVMEP